MNRLSLFAILLLLLVSCTDEAVSPEPLAPNYRFGVWGEDRATILEREKEAGFTFSDEGERVSVMLHDREETYLFSGGRLSGAETVYFSTTYQAYSHRMSRLDARARRQGETLLVWRSEEAQAAYGQDLERALQDKVVEMHTTFETPETITVLSISHPAGESLLMEAYAPR